MSSTRKQASLHVTALAGAVLLGMSSMVAHAAELRSVNRPIEGEYIVVLKPEAASLAGEPSLLGRVNRSQVATIAQQISRSHSARLVRSYKKALRGFAVKADDKALARLLADPRVAYVQENGIVELAATQNNAIWSLDRIDQRDLPLSTSYTYDTNAAGVHAYIIDTGIRADHTEFTGRVGAGFTSELDGRGTADCQGHGTHVAGTVGGTQWGVAKGVTLHPVRVFGCGATTTTDKILAGIDWVTQNHIKPAVVNMSLGSGADQAKDDATQAMINAGVITVIAAGNNNGNACLNSPGRVPAAITVGATMSNDRRPDPTNWGVGNGSNFGACLDIFAPGDNITSAAITGGTATSTPNSGTSMAAPAVAGAAALYLAVHPLATQAEVAQAIIDGASTNKVTNAGANSPNKLLYSLLGGGNPPDNTPPVANFSSSANGLTVSFTDSSTDSDGSIASRSWNFGDGTSSTATSPSKTYAAAGTYTVTLTVTDNGGATHAKTSSVTVTSTTPPTGNVLANGVAKAISGAAGSSQIFTLAVPAGATSLKFVTSGGTGDADLYVKFNGTPSTTSFDCKSEGSTNAETCNIATAQAGTYSVLIKGYSAFSGTSLTGSYTAGGGGGTQTYSSTTDYTIGDKLTVDSPITVSGRTGNAPSNASVTVAIAHTFRGDLKVDLVAPDGSTYLLKNYNANDSADDVNGTVTLNLSSEALNGTWKLRVNDNAVNDTGKIDSWSVTF